MPYDLVLSAGPATPPFALPGWGVVHVDAATASVIASGFLDAGGAATVLGAVPNSPYLAGLSLWLQAVLPAQQVLTGAVKVDVGNF